ncbi:hypothetical protein [Pseudomonas sp. WS 5079]|uniref:hypothetical protein n=1 Tax=Pseudomonas sp. WS 5079 TaxID=2717492 RepID=UPI0015523AE2|nr:hypothetical protein [Pseudomonas sp. WS 5079]NMX60225.1 hypothetical protein [Pseudomonas sp. WS 5079]
MSASVQPTQGGSGTLGGDFAEKLASFNDLNRSLREAGIQPQSAVLSDNKIFISPDSVDLLSRRFGHELRAIRYSTKGAFTYSTVTIRGVDVVWFELVKEQGQ